MSSEETIRRVSSLRDLRILLTQDETGRADYLYPYLELGDMWWIPDSITGFSKDRSQHPWAIVNGYSPLITSIIVTPRTSSYRTPDLKRGVLTPANIIPGLEKEGLLLLSHRRSISILQFCDFEYIGRLPETWIILIRDFNKSLAEGKIKR